MLVFYRQVLQHFSQSGQYPSITSSPEILLAIDCLVLRIDVFCITIIKILIFIEHNAIRINQIFIQLIQVFRIMSNLIEFCHYRHCHIQRITPPPVIMLRGTHLVLHNLTRTLDFLIVRSQIIQISISLKTNLIVAKQHIFIRLSVRIFPLRTVITLRSLPLVVVCPGFRISTISLVSSQKIGFHISRMIYGIIPERTNLRRIFCLPMLIYLINHLPDLNSLGISGPNRHRQYSDSAGQQQFKYLFHSFILRLIYFQYIHRGCF